MIAAAVLFVVACLPGAVTVAQVATGTHYVGRHR